MSTSFYYLSQASLFCAIEVYLNDYVFIVSVYSGHVLEPECKDSYSLDPTRQIQAFVMTCLICHHPTSSLVGHCIRPGNQSRLE